MDTKTLLVDLAELEAWIARSGKSKTYLAKKMGITLQTLYNKLQGKSDFTCYEAAVLKKELRIREVRVFMCMFGFLDEDGL